MFTNLSRLTKSRTNNENHMFQSKILKVYLFVLVDTISLVPVCVRLFVFRFKISRTKTEGVYIFRFLFQKTENQNIFFLFNPQKTKLKTIVFSFFF